MGFITPGISPGAGGGTISDGYATLLAAVTAAVSDNPDDGALYQTTDGAVYAWDSTSKVLWPVDIYGRIEGVLSNVTGDGYMLLADALADTTGRGWVVETTGAGTVTKTAGAAAVCDAPNPPSTWADLEFFSSGAETSVAALVCVSGVTGTNMASTRIRLFGGGKEIRLTVTDGAAGTGALLQSYNQLEADAGGRLEVATAADTWVLLVIDTDVDEICYARAVEGQGVISVDANDTITDTVVGLELNAQNTTSISSSLSAKIAAVVELSS